MRQTILESACIALIVLLPHLVMANPTTGLAIPTTETGNKRRHNSQWHAVRRSVLDNLPLKPSPVIMVPLTLQETVDKDLDPRPEDLDEIRLLNKLGTDFDSQYVSISPPLEMKTHPDGVLEYAFKRGEKPRGPMPQDFAILDNRSIKLSEDGPEIKVRASKKTRKKLQKFLWAYSYCPVRYKWQELSTRFWPRYIKTGSCENKRSCSMPAGMTCQPSKLKHIPLLRFYCPTRGAQKSCQWIKIDYPVLSECSCGCQAVQRDDDYDYTM